MNFYLFFFIQLAAFSLNAQTYYSFEIKGLVTDVAMVPQENYPVLIYNYSDSKDTIGTFYTNASGAFATTTPVLQFNADRVFGVELIDCNGSKVIKYVQSHQGTASSGTANFSICPVLLTTIPSLQESSNPGEKTSFQFFPNPSNSGIFYIKGKNFNNSIFAIEDLYGREIPIFHSSDGLIDLSTQSKSVYIVKYFFQGKKEQATLIVE